MGLSGRDIVCMSNHYWDERRYRKQEFMSRFARANRVLYVEPSFSTVRRPQDHHRGVAANRFLLPRIEQRSERLFLLKPPRALPFWSRPWVERLNYRWYGGIVGRAARRIGFRDAIAWVYTTGYYHALPSIPHRRLVFDLTDDISAYGGGHWDHVERAVEGLVAQSDLFVATARTLLDRHRAAAAEAVLATNGFDAGLFSPRRAAGRTPPALAELPRPILGFVGTLFTFLDFELLERVARAHRDKSLALVGPVEADVEPEVARLLEHPNVFHLGAAPQAEVPAYVASFDVCLNPFLRGRVADSVSPLKVYEYLAMGRPVVSTPMRALQQEEDVAAAIAFADDAAGFCAAIDACLSADGEAAAEARRAAVEPYSWDRIFERLDAACEDALAP